MEFKDYYAVLGVSRGVSDKEIKQTYRKLARQYHPDVNPNDKNAEAHFREINEAYTVLSDPEKRKRYDELGANWDKVAQEGFSGAPGGGYTFRFSRDQGGGFEDLFGGGGFSDFFRAFFGEGPADFGFGQRERVAPGLYEIEVSLEEVYHGASKSILLPISVRCGKCGGRGSLRRSLCPDCRGQGEVVQQKRVELQIPKGIEEGKTLRLRLEGREIHLKVKYLPHPFFKVQPGGDLACERSLPFLDCILGGELPLPTLKGKTVIKIPAGTQNGATLRLKGLGLPVNGRVSDLFVTLKVSLPVAFKPEEKRLYEELKSLKTKG